MQPDLSKLRYLVGDEAILSSIQDVPALPIFFDRIVELFSDMSRMLLNNRSIKKYKDIMGYAYWIRKASILPQKNHMTRTDKKLGRGLSFHIAPSNIPIQFAVSMVSALLAGNSCVIRVSSKEYEQVNIICNAFNDLLGERYQDLAGYVCIIRYDYDDEVTAWLSSICDVRIIWGGNETIRYIRQFPIPARSIELTFADRYSFAIIDSDVLVDADIAEVIDAFWTDTFYVDQNACSSPRLIAWTGSQKESARKKFWDTLHSKVKKEYELAPIQAVNKLSAFSELAMLMGGVTLESFDNYIFRVKVDTIPNPTIMNYKNGGGYFFEYYCDDIKSLIPLMDNKGCQTVALFGIETEDMKKMVFDLGLKGVDRIVSIGKTTAPGLDWDGYALVDSMSRYVEVEKLCC